MDFATWITVFTVGVLVVLSPGPNWAITIKNSLLSRKNGLSTVLGMAVGSLIHISYCLVGIGVIISKSILLFSILKWAGATYLIYIGIKSLKAKKQSHERLALSQKQHLTFWRAFSVGFLTDLLNPKATLFYLALFTQVIQPSTHVIAQSFYGLSVVMVEVVWYSLMVFFLTHDLIRKGFLSISHWVERVTGAVFIILGLRLAFTKAN